RAYHDNRVYQDVLTHRFRVDVQQVVTAGAPVVRPVLVIQKGPDGLEGRHAVRVDVGGVDIAVEGHEQQLAGQLPGGDEDRIILDWKHAVTALLIGELAVFVQRHGQQRAVAADGGEAARRTGHRYAAPASSRGR